MKKNNLIILLIILSMIPFFSCKKEKGPKESEDESSLINYEVLKEFKTDEGKIGMEVYVDKDYKRKRVVDLAKNFQEEHGDNLGIIKIYNDKKLSRESLFIIVLKNQLRFMQKHDASK